MAKQRNNYFSRNRNLYHRRSWLWYLKALRKWEDKFMFLLQLVSLLAKWNSSKEKSANSCCFGHLACVFVCVADSAFGLTQAWSNPLITGLLPALKPISLNSSSVKVWRILHHAFIKIFWFGDTKLPKKESQEAPKQLSLTLPEAELPLLLP